MYWAYVWYLLPLILIVILITERDVEEKQKVHPVDGVGIENEKLAKQHHSFVQYLSAIDDMPVMEPEASKIRTVDFWLEHRVDSNGGEVKES